MQLSRHANVTHDGHTDTTTPLGKNVTLTWKRYNTSRRSTTTNIQQLLAEKLGLDSIEELEAAIDAMDGIDVDG